MEKRSRITPIHGLHNERQRFMCSFQVPAAHVLNAVHSSLRVKHGEAHLLANVRPATAVEFHTCVTKCGNRGGGWRWRSCTREDHFKHH